MTSLPLPESAIPIFVFGSNLSGIHGAGAASFALKHRNAVWGQGIGMQGLSYAVPTKDKNIKTLPLSEIKKYVDDFLNYASKTPGLTFQVTRIGCGLAGYVEKDIAPMFRSAPSNCQLCPEFIAWLKENP